MSNKTELKIVEVYKTLNKKQIKKAIKDYIKRYEDVLFEKDKTKRYIEYIDGDVYLLDTYTGEVFKDIVHYDFISMFECLRDYWYMDIDSSLRISDLDAYLLRQAANYLLHGKYSREIENIMDNPYINLLGMEYTPYVSKSNKPVLCNEDKIYEQYFNNIVDCIGVYLNGYDLHHAKRCLLYTYL